jgi:uncharacterized protein YegL
MSFRPGVRLARRPLHFFFVLDGSGSMNTAGKIEALNSSIRQALPHLQEVAEQSPFVEVLVRAVVFASGARWHVEVPTPVGEVQWTDVAAAGSTDLGAALGELTAVLRMPPMQARAFPPVIVLVSDGRPTDDFDAALEQLMAEPWGRRAVRLAIAIGADADLDVLQQFIGDPQIAPFSARDPDHLAYLIRFVSIVASRLSSTPATDAAAQRSLLAAAPQPAESDVLLSW